MSCHAVACGVDFFNFDLDAAKYKHVFPHVIYDKCGAVNRSVINGFVSLGKVRAAASTLPLLLLNPACSLQNLQP